MPGEGGRWKEPGTPSEVGPRSLAGEDEGLAGCRLWLKPISVSDIQWYTVIYSVEEPPREREREIL